jgi:hypothetical protein
VIYIIRPIEKKIIQNDSISNFPSDRKSAVISKNVKDATIEKNVENSLLRTVLNENGIFGFCQFLNRG